MSYDGSRWRTEKRGLLGIIHSRTFGEANGRRTQGTAGLQRARHLGLVKILELFSSMKNKSQHQSRVGLTQSRTLPTSLWQEDPQSAYPKQLTDPATYGGVYSGIPPDRHAVPPLLGLLLAGTPKTFSPQ